MPYFGQCNVSRLAHMLYSIKIIIFLLLIFIVWLYYMEASQRLVIYSLLINIWIFFQLLTVLTIVVMCTFNKKIFLQAFFFTSLWKMLRSGISTSSCRLIISVKYVQQYKMLPNTSANGCSFCTSKRNSAASTCSIAYQHIFELSKHDSSEIVI